MRNYFRSCLPVLAALPGLVWAQSAPASPMPDAGASLMQMLLGLIVVVAAIFAVLWLIKRLSMAPGKAAGALRIVGGTSVGPRERVVLLEVEDTWLLVGVAPGQVRALHQMPKGQLVDKMPAAQGKDFSAWLRQVMERKHAR